MLADFGGIDRAGQAQSPAERATPFREIETTGVRVHVRTATGEVTPGIRNDPMTSRTRVATGCHDS